MNQTILNSWRGNETFSMINQMQIMIMYNTEVLQFNLCDYKDAYIFVKGDITVTAASAT